MVNVHIKNISIRHDAQLSFIETGQENLFAYKSAVSKHRLNGKEKFSDTLPIQEGLVLTEAFYKLENFEYPRAFGKNAAGFFYWSLVTNKFLKEIAKYGWAGKNGEYKHFDTEISCTPFTDIVKKKRRRLIKINNNCHMLFDKDDNPLPVGIYCDYIEAQMNSRKYDLNKAFKILKKHPRIILNTEEGPELIPRYNNDSGREEYLCFSWEPTLEEMGKLWDQCLSYGEKYPSVGRYRAIFDLDLLGLRKGGAELRG